MRSGARSLPWIAVALCAGAAAPQSEVPGSTPAAVDPTFAGEVVVREVDVRFDRSVLPPLESLGRRGEEDFVYYEDGRPCPTLRFEPEGDGKDWHLVVWLDARLAGADALSVAARELASRASALAGAASVEIVEASDPAPRSLGEFRGASAISVALTRAAAAMPRGPAPIDPTDAGARIDRMVVTLADRPAEGPRAVLVPASGWSVDETTLAQVAAARRGEAAPSWAEALTGGARALAATGWVPIVLGLSGAKSPEVSPGAQPTVTLGPGGDTRISYPVLSVPSSAAPSADRLDTALDLSLAPLANLARPGSGALVGSGAHLAATLARLLRRSRLVARAPEPALGAVVQREIRWVGGDGRTLPTPTLTSSGPSRDLAAARLRLRLAGDRDSGQLSAVRVVDRSPLRICLADDASSATLRYAHADAGALGPEIAFGEPLRLRREDGEICVGDDLDPGAGPGAVRLVEDLERGEWLLL